MISSILNLAGPDIVTLALICFILFGAKAIPKWARSIKETRDELRKMNDDKEDK